jgi:hypothetical protein
MRFRKIIVDDLDVFRKRRVQVGNSNVSIHADEYTCEGICVWVKGDEPSFGTSKQETGVSNRHYINGLSGLIHGG